LSSDDRSHDGEHGDANQGGGQHVKAEVRSGMQSECAQGSRKNKREHRYRGPEALPAAIFPKALQNAVLIQGSPTRA
jgi:hypothetical protein